MKIASVYSFQAFPPKGGNHLHALQLIRQFQSAGHQVLTWGDSTVPGVRTFARDAEGQRTLEAEADILYIRIDGNKLGNDSLMVDLIANATKPMVWEINSPADENLAFSYLGGGARPSGAVAQRLDGAKRALHALRQLPGIKREDALRRALGRRAFGAVCVSNAVARYAREALNLQHVHVIPNGSDPNRIFPSGPVAEVPVEFADRLKVLYAGSPIYPWQGLDILSEAMALCSEAGDKICFILLLNQRGLYPVQARNAVIRERVPHEEVPAYLRAADVAVVSHPEFPWSPWGAYFSPMKMFDYMACGCPVVGSNLGQIAEVIEDGRNGYLFDNTAEGLRQSLLRALSGRQRLLDMGKVARRDIEEIYNWRNIATKTLAIFESAIAAHGRV